MNETKSTDFLTRYPEGTVGRAAYLYLTKNNLQGQVSPWHECVHGAMGGDPSTIGEQINTIYEYTFSKIDDSGRKKLRTIMTNALISMGNVALAYGDGRSFSSDELLAHYQNAVSITQHIKARTGKLISALSTDEFANLPMEFFEEGRQKLAKISVANQRTRRPYNLSDDSLSDKIMGVLQAARGRGIGAKD